MKKFFMFTIRCILNGIGSTIVFIVLLLILAKLNIAFFYPSLEDVADTDIVSLQISLLEIILAAMSVGIAVFGFIGWQKIQDIIAEKVEERIKTQYDEQSKHLLDELINEAFAKRNIGTITKEEILDEITNKK